MGILLCRPTGQWGTFISSCTSPHYQNSSRADGCKRPELLFTKPKQRCSGFAENPFTVLFGFDHLFSQ